MKKKTKSLRGKSDKKPGAQQGHAGKGLAQVSILDLEDVFGIAISSGTCTNVDEKLFRQLESFESSLKAYTKKSHNLRRTDFYESKKWKTKTNPRRSP